MRNWTIISSRRPEFTITTYVRWAFLATLLIGAGAHAGSSFVPFGVDFSPYENGQNPNTGIVLKTNEVANRLKSIRGCSQWIRTFSVTHGLETTGALAHRAGFKAALEAWLGPENDAAGLVANQQEISDLIAAANRGEADLAIVGSEVLLRGDLSANTLVSYMQQVRSSVPSNIPVTTADTYNTLLANPDAIAASDVVLGNFYPYWEGTRIDGAIASLDAEYRALSQAAGSKAIWVGETGWPSGGNAVNLAVPSPQNAAYYWLAVNSWSQSNNVNVFYFEAFDEAWKAASEGPQGVHWGIRTSAGELKAWMNLVYEGYTLPEAVWMRQIPAATLPGPPSIQVTKIPAYGSANGIGGLVSGVNTANYDVATYINVAGGWWTKPFFDQPTVPINPDGTFTVATVTGGEDADATEYEVFLVPSSYTPPTAGGDYSVPADIFSHAVAFADVQRPVGYKGSVTNPPIVKIGSLAITRSFSSKINAIDTVVIAGTIPIEDTKAQGATITVNIGSNYWQFAPVAKNGIATASGGSWENAAGKIVITAGKNQWTFSAKLQCAPDNTVWNEQGLLNTTIMAPGIPVFMLVTITVNGQSYGRIISGYYTAQAGKTGSLNGSSTELDTGL
jgi:exo-beta-1,3-glucanase (GH17 family)